MRSDNTDTRVRLVSLVIRVPINGELPVRESRDFDVMLVW